MTPEGNEIHTLLNGDKWYRDDEELSKLIQSTEKKMPAMSEIYKEMMYNNIKIFKALSFVFYNKPEQDKIVAEFLGVEPVRVTSAHDPNEVKRMTSMIMMCEALAEIKKTASHACGIGSKEFLISWYQFNDMGYLKDIVINKIDDPTVLHDDFRPIYERIKTKTTPIIIRKKNG